MRDASGRVSRHLLRNLMPSITGIMKSAITTSTRSFCTTPRACSGELEVMMRYDVSSCRKPRSAVVTIASSSTINTVSPVIAPLLSADQAAHAPGEALQQRKCELGMVGEEVVEIGATDAQQLCRLGGAR